MKGLCMGSGMRHTQVIEISPNSYGTCCLARKKFASSLNVWCLARENLKYRLSKSSNHSQHVSRSASSNFNFSSTKRGRAIEAVQQDQKMSSTEEHLEPDVFRPRKSTAQTKTRELLLVFLPGAFTPPDAYVPLVNAVQAASDLDLWVGILKFPSDIASQDVIRKQYEVLKEKVRGMGYNDGPDSLVFFAGHSLGAWEGRAPALHLAHGFIQICSYFNPAADSLPEYPKPVLSIGGEYDGQLPIPLFARAAGEVAYGEAQLGKDYLLANKPVVIIDGMNHAQVSHGIINAERGDLESPIPIEEAREKLAEVMAAFLAVQAGRREARAGSGAAMDVLRRWVEGSEKWWKPFWEASKLDKEGWEEVPAALVEDSGLTNDVPPFRSEIVWHSFKDNFVISKPWVDPESKTLFCQAFLKPQGKFGISSTMWLKVKSPRALQSSLHSTSLSSNGANQGQEDGAVDRRKDRGAKVVTSSNPNLSPEDFLLRAGAKINEQAFDRAWELCSEAVKTKYEARGKKLKFVDDEFVQSSVTWIESDVTFVPSAENPREVEVQSPCVATSLNTVPAKFGGMYYLKVLTVGRAMEWIVADAYQ